MYNKGRDHVPDAGIGSTNAAPFLALDPCLAQEWPASPVGRWASLLPDQQRAVWFGSPGTLRCSCLLLPWGKHEARVESGGGSLSCPQAQSVKNEAGEKYRHPMVLSGRLSLPWSISSLGCAVCPQNFLHRGFHLCPPPPWHFISPDPLSLSVAAFLCYYLCSSPCWPSRSLALPTNQPYMYQGAKCFSNSRAEASSQLLFFLLPSQWQLSMVHLPFTHST